MPPRPTTPEPRPRKMQAPPIAPRGRIGRGRYGRQPGTAVPTVRIEPPPPPPKPLPPVSDQCVRGNHHRCHGTVYTLTPVDGKYYVRCQCPVEDCGHGSGPRRRG